MSGIGESNPSFSLGKRMLSRSTNPASSRYFTRIKLYLHHIVILVYMAKEKLEKLLQNIYTSYKANRRLDPLEDFKAFLELKKVKYKLTLQTPDISKIPTIIIANHFVRPLILRRSILTTSESIITSGIISQIASICLGKKITWVVKNDLTENIFFLNLKVRKIQLAAIFCYDFIGVSKNYPF